VAYFNSSSPLDSNGYCRCDIACVHVRWVLNRWVIEELMGKERAAREHGVALDREIHEYSRQIEEVKEAKAQASAAARSAFGADDVVKTEYPPAGV
jgi:hypothetical protein